MELSIKYLTKGSYTWAQLCSLLTDKTDFTQRTVAEAGPSGEASFSYAPCWSLSQVLILYYASHALSLTHAEMGKGI